MSHERLDQLAGRNAHRLHAARDGSACRPCGGGLDDGSENEPLAVRLADDFTVVNYARAGRGASGDHAAYTVARELEDLAAVAALVAEPVHVVGVSSGGMFALEAALSTVPLGRIAVYDVPYDTGSDAGPRYDHYRSELAAALAADRRGDAVALFMTLAGVPADEVDQARGSTAWPAVERLAHTLAYDAELYGPLPSTGSPPSPAPLSCSPAARERSTRRRPTPSPTPSRGHCG